MESKEKKVRQYRSNQGRSPERMEGSYKAIGYSFVILVLAILCSLVYKHIV
jgi:hypothetical protein